jgi:hypothetical protein
MRATIYRSIILGLALGVSVEAWSRDLTGQWDLKIENKEHHVVTVFVIEFTTRRVSTCSEGIWSRVDVVSVTTENSTFFPVSDPALSYKVEDNRLALGHTDKCDSGTLLLGVLNNETIRGDYYRIGLGPSHHGFFTLSKRK